VPAVEAARSDLTGGAAQGSERGRRNSLAQHWHLGQDQKANSVSDFSIQIARTSASEVHQLIRLA